MNFIQRLNEGRLFFDGGTGTLLQEKGLKGGELPERWNLTHPEEIVSLHTAYLKAGSDIICTNTFGANRLKFPGKEGGELREVIESAVAHAQEARRLTGRADAFVALDIGPSGKLLRPMGDLDFEEAVELFAETVRIGSRAGADLILIETMSDSYETKAAVLAAKENSSLPVVVTNVYGENQTLLTGGTVAGMVAMLEGLRVDAIGVNCGMGPAQMLPIVRELAAYSSLPLVVNPNAGLPRSEGGKTVYDVTPEAFAQVMEEIADLGAGLLGGCCGTTPAHIRAMIERCRNKPYRPPEPKQRTLVSSFSQVVEIGPRPVLIGERINPTGKSRFKQALREKNIDYILNEGFAQEEAGADILDVNVGLPDIDEPQMLEDVVCALQSVIPLPLQIDTSHPQAMERALRRYNGKPMLNSVNGKRESMETVFPLIQKYGGVVVGLTLDETSIPETAAERSAIAGRIYETAGQYGIPAKDIVIDVLTLTVSSDSRAAQTTLEALQLVRKQWGAHTVLGVSNVSFGLPQRETVNANFFTMALQNGLSCGIINPRSEGMMRAYRAYCVLSGLDAQCSGYIAAYGGQPGTSSLPARETVLSGNLEECIERGLRDGACQAAKQALLEGAEPLSLVNTQLIPALDRVGQGFERGSIFLPQLLMSAEAAKAAFDVVKEAMQGQAQEKKGKVVLATVKGDIHDIGKNIVKVLLENYAFDVIDLGKDVPPGKIVEAAMDPEVRLVGLSALMTTTVPSMEETIRLLREREAGVQVVVGGAVLTPEYAARMGADCYARDAMATVHFAQQIYGCG